MQHLMAAGELQLSDLPIGLYFEGNLDGSLQAPFPGRIRIKFMRLQMGRQSRQIVLPDAFYRFLCRSGQWRFRQGALRHGL